MRIFTITANRIKKYDCPEPYITEQELIKQLIGYLPKIRLNTNYLMQEFAVEVKRLQHFKFTVMNEQLPVNLELTPHNTTNNMSQEISDTQSQMIKEYLLHVLQFETPEDRIKILKGVTSKFVLADRLLLLS